MERPHASGEESHSRSPLTGKDVEVRRRASRLGRWVAMGSTLVLAVYLVLTLRTLAPAWRSTGRWLAGASVAAWYWLTYSIVRRIALEWLR